MRIESVLTLTAIYLLAIPGCDSPESTVEAHGFLATTHTNAADDRRCVTFVPHDRASEQKLLVVLFLNGGDENGVDGLQHVSRNFDP